MIRMELIGHAYKYAAEQIILALFPKERISYSADSVTCSSDITIKSSLSTGAVFAQATAAIYCNGKVSRGAARIGVDKLSGKLITDRLLQRIVKQSIYKAATANTGVKPVWGSLTGIRPAKLATTALESGKSTGAATRMLVSEYHVSPVRAEMCLDAALAAVRLKNTLSPADIALYIGIPFCPTRCAYCSFVSNSVEKSFNLIEPFTQTILDEIGIIARTTSDLGLRVITVYIGGGTPTALPPESLEAIMRTLRDSFDLCALREYTVEAGRPDTLTQQKLDIMLAHGATRICVNPQSMSLDVLRKIGRCHTPEDVFTAVKLIRQSDAALNMDVIAGLPGDTPGGFRETLDALLDLNPENITVHTLSLKKGSRIMLEDTEVPGGGDVAEMLGYASERLRAHHYRPYYIYRQKFTSGGFENTGWCFAEREGVYNICMMEELCTVLALGGGGVTKLVSSDGRIERIFNAKYPLEYIQHNGKITDKSEKVREFYSGG